MPTPFRILVVGPKTGWHVLDLKRAAKQLHDVALDSISYPELRDAVQVRQCSDKMSRQCGPLFEFHAALVRAMPSSSLEQVVFRMDVLARMESSGVFFPNPAKSIEMAVDKYLALWSLESSGIPVPETRVSQTIEHAIEDFQSLGRDVVVKPLFGSLGNRVYRLSSDDNAIRYFEDQVSLNRVIYQQRFVNHGGSDLRILVVGQMTYSMKRIHRSHWVTNIHQGAKGEPFQPDPELIGLARKAAESIGTQIAGVDLVFDRCTRKWLVLEINSAPGWRAMSEVLQIDVASEILGWLVANLRMGKT